MNKTAEDFAKEQKEISVSEFFEKNKHLLGFDNPTKALLMAVKEAVDNSLDACQEADILPDIIVKIKELEEEKYQITVQDNGPGIVKENIGRVFGKLLYGSKFHRLIQGRGQQGIGISSITLYSQLTTGEPSRVWSKVESKKVTHYCELHLNTMKNEPDIIKQEDIDKDVVGDHGVKIEMIIKGRYRKTVEDYMKYTSVSNPFAKLNYTGPDGTKITYPRSVNEFSKPPKQIKPHPYGMEFGTLQRILKNTSSRSITSFLTNEFSSVGSQTAKEICKFSKLSEDLKPNDIDRASIEKLIKAMQSVKVQRPPTDCLSPIGQDHLEKSLKKEYPNSEFISSITREPDVYRGFPFLVEVGIVYGGDLKADGPIELIRLANRVPLLFQAGACGLTEAVKDVDWKRYNMQQSSGSLPLGPMILVVHICSVWVPFVSESKEAVAPYPEIVKEVKLAVQDAGRKLGLYLSGKRRAGEQKRRMLIFERYATETAEAISKLTGRNLKEVNKVFQELILNRNKLREFEEQESKTVPEKSSNNGEE